MPTNYAGSDLSYPANVPLPNDGEPAAAAFLNPAWQRLADRTAYMKGMADRERSSELAIIANHTLTIAEQLAFVNITGGGLVTLPDPALAVGRIFRLRLSSVASKISRLLPHAAETINGIAGYPLSIPGSIYTVFTPDGVNWIASQAAGSPLAPTMRVFYASDPGGGAGITSQVYGSGFERLNDTWLGNGAVRQNGFEITGVGGSWTYHDDGWITIVTGGGGGGVDLWELVIRDAEDPDYDGSTERAASVATGVSG